MTIPLFVFLVPYRNMEEHLNIYLCVMPWILEDMKHWEIYIVHQKDDRPFNRGGTKNAGFLYIKEKYPNDYKDITLVFQDVDTIPTKKNIISSFESSKGSLKHFFGFNYALGGLISVKASDFELMNGFPNYWGYGFEDSHLIKRCKTHHISIDRTCFYDITKNQKEFIRFPNSKTRQMSKNPVYIEKNTKPYHGIREIKNIIFEEKVVQSNIYQVDCTNWSINTSHKQEFKTFNYGDSRVYDSEGPYKKKRNIMQEMLDKDKKRRLKSRIY